jgi:hypothetical protein
VQIFENKGEIMGCSNPHPHGQIWAGDFIPNEAAKEDAAQKRWKESHGGVLLLDYARTEAECGDRVVVKGHGNERVLEVVRVIDKRVGAPVAAECFVDHSPPPPPPDMSAPLLTRDRATGRPTKKDRRQIDRFRRG